MTSAPSLLDLLADRLNDVETAWSIGTFGAIAEFTRDADEAAAISRVSERISVVTARGGLRIEACRDLRPIASESLTAQSWSHRVALCLPEQACAMSRRSVLTEIGPDQDALRAEDRAAILFDLGLGALQVDVCIRSSDAAVVVDTAEVHRKIGVRPRQRRDGFDPGVKPAPGLHQPGRAHRGFPADPAAGWEKPRGSAQPRSPQTTTQRAHSRGHRAAAGGLDSLRPFLSAESGAGPVRPSPTVPRGAPRGFPSRCWLATANRNSLRSNGASSNPWRRVAGRLTVSLADDRFTRATVRVALRQLKALDQTSPALAEWLSAHDRFEAVEAEDTMGAHH